MTIFEGGKKWGHKWYYRIEKKVINSHTFEKFWGVQNGYFIYFLLNFEFFYRVSYRITARARRARRLRISQGLKIKKNGVERRRQKQRFSRDNLKKRTPKNHRKNTPFPLAVRKNNVARNF